ncbi:uncharacterized membrane protein DDB_G0293934-like isoform X2 [Frankliniella occidentalis]|uniref:Uncharacterized membrane protein DDB_G0293934-like isoform X2 n=1 Tax=Frankliniella occidentalis TaxID=133901 RepID=A0A9C6XST2_FRAOC|nr:uncharacterized membrane protein DDB_G0293934-like isoform X2 [Frankliniella occidentalis]
MSLFKLGRTCFRNPFCENNASRKKEEKYYCISDTFLLTQSVSKENTASDEQGVANVKIGKIEADSNSRNSSSAVYSCITPLSRKYLERRNNEEKIPNNCNVEWGRETDPCEEELIEIARNETPRPLPDHEILESFPSEATACISVNTPEKTVGSHFISKKYDSKELQMSSIDNEILETSSIESGDNNVRVNSVTCKGYSILHHPKSDEHSANETNESSIEEFLLSSSSVSNSNNICSNTKIDCVSGNGQETFVVSQPPAVVSETCETQLQSSTYEKSFNSLTAEIDIGNGAGNSLVCHPISNECKSNESHELSNEYLLQSACSVSNPNKACPNSRVDCVFGNGQENRVISYPLAVLSATSEIQLQSSSHEEILNNACDTFTVEIEIGNGAGNSLESHPMSVDNGDNDKKNEPSIDKEILQPSSNEGSVTIPCTNVMVNCKPKNCHVNSAISDDMETSNLEEPILPLPSHRRRGNRQSSAVVNERDRESDQQFSLDSHCATVESEHGVSTKSDAFPVSSLETLNRASGSPTESYDKSFYVGSLIKESILVVNNIDNFNTSEDLLNHLCYASEYQAHDNNGAHSSAHNWSSDAEVNTFLSTEDLQCDTSSNACTDNSFGLLMSDKTESLFKAKVANNQLNNSSFGNTVHNKSNLKQCRLKQSQRKGKLKIVRPVMKSTQTQGRKKQRSIVTKHMLAFQCSDSEEASNKCTKVTQNSSWSSQLSTKVKEITKSFTTPIPKKIHDRDPVSVCSENQSALRKSAEVPEEHFSEIVGIGMNIKTMFNRHTAFPPVDDCAFSVCCALDDNNNKETAALKSSANSAGSSEEPKRLVETNSHSEKYVPKLFAAFSNFIQAVPKPVPLSSEHEPSHIDRRDAWKKIFELAKARQKRI